MQLKPITILIGMLIALILLTGTCAAGFVAGQVIGQADGKQAVDLPFLPSLSNPLAGPTTSDPEADTPEDSKELFRPFWQAWDLVNQMYVDQPVNKTVLMRGAIKGMVDALGDEHSSYLDPAMFKEANEHLEGQEYEGIGAWVDVTGEYLRIISPMPGSPAEEADLRPGDQVIAIDGEDMTGKDGEYARQHVLGPAGSTVRLTILREGVEKPFDVDVKRGAIVVPSVTGKMLDEGIAYVQLYTFGDDTAKDLRDTLKDLIDHDPKGLILDLRNNGGGYLNTAIDVVSEFISDDVVMIEEYGDGRRDTYEAKRGGVATKIPLIVLINEGSASASEIVAGAIQDRGRGYLVGAQSYGKGSVQNYVELTDNQGAVRVTIARWLTPNGRQIHKVGLSPDFPVELNPDATAQGGDTQLEQAIKVLLDGLLPPPTPIPSPTPTVTPVP